MIVCMSRRICVDLYHALIKLQPEGESETLKVVMTGSAEDGPEWQRHIGNKQRRLELADQFKDAKNPYKIVIIRDMWLTGFDPACLHAMYADKPMQGHGLMQAIARVNRVFRDKPGGLEVDCGPCCAWSVLGARQHLRLAGSSGEGGEDGVDAGGVVVRGVGGVRGREMKNAELAGVEGRGLD